MGVDIIQNIFLSLNGYIINKEKKRNLVNMSNKKEDE